MTPGLRHRLALFIVGVAAAIVGMSVATWMRQDACHDAGGRWLAVERTCALAGGATATLPTWRAVAVALVAGALVATLTWRAYTFFLVRGARRR